MTPRSMRLLMVPSGPKRIASARIRAFQYVAPLEALGVRCTVLPAMGDATARLRVLSARMPRLAKLLYYAIGVLDKTLRVVPVLWLASRNDVVYLQRTTFPAGVATLLRWINPRIVFDFDDAIQMRDPGDRETGVIGRLKERAKARAVPAILGASRCAIVEHGILEEYARQHCTRVERIPGPIDTSRFAPRRGARADGPVVIGWTGTPSTSAYLPIAVPALRRVAERHDIEVHLIGSGPLDIPGVRVRVFPWSEDEEVRRLQSFDIGIMPMPDTEWTRGKLGVKMLLYMAVGIPAVVSYTPVNAEVISHGIDGSIVASDEEWESELETLVRNEALRRRIGDAGRRTVMTRFSLEHATPRLKTILEAVSA